MKTGDPAPGQNESAEMRLHDAVERDLQPYFATIEENFRRLSQLVDMYLSIDQAHILPEEVSTKLKNRSGDLLRAVVVYTHAYLEDFLRTLASVFLPGSNERTLNDIPLIRLNDTGRPEKFFLGKLAEHRGKLVDDVIKESVGGYLERSTFNSTSEIAILLEKLNLSGASCKEFFPALQAMIERRHVIVHRADKVKPTDGRESLQAIDSEQVLWWMHATLHFMAALIPSLYIKQNPPEVLEKKFDIRIIKNDDAEKKKAPSTKKIE